MSAQYSILADLFLTKNMIKSLIYTKKKNISSELAMVIGCITESQKLINDAIKSEQKGGNIKNLKQLTNMIKCV